MQGEMMELLIKGICVGLFMHLMHGEAGLTPKYLASLMLLSLAFAI